MLLVRLLHWYTATGSPRGKADVAEWKPALEEEDLSSSPPFAIKVTSGNFLTALGLRYLFSTVLTVSDLCNLPSASIPVRKSPKPLFSLIRFAGA